MLNTPTSLRVKLADFGFACKNQPLSSKDNFCGTIHLMSPEQLSDDQTYDNRVDIWTLGHLLYELLTGQHVFEEDEEFSQN